MCPAVMMMMMIIIIINLQDGEQLVLSLFHTRINSVTDYRIL